MIALNRYIKPAKHVIACVLMLGILLIPANAAPTSETIFDVVNDTRVYNLVPDMQAGDTSILAIDLEGGFELWGLFNYNTFNVPVNRISSGNLTVQIDDSSWILPATLDIYPITSNWTNEVTYNLKPSLGAIFNSTSIISVYPTIRTINVTDLIKSWDTVDKINRGIAIKTAAGGKYYIRSKEFGGGGYGSFLTVQYYDPYQLTPANLSTTPMTYPPLYSSINFTWLTSHSATNLQVARDINYNILSVDTTVSQNYSTVSLSAGTYYWRLRSYNTTTLTYGEWTDSFQFTITESAPANTNSIQGITYELINTAETPISEATVYIYNASWSSQQTSGSNGYFLFTGLANGTVYYLKSTKKDYMDSPIETVNVSGATTRNILMKPTEPTWFEADKQYVKFKVRWLYCIINCVIPNVQINVYKSGEVIPYKSDVTDSTGSISFLLFKTQKYHVTAINSTIGINNDMIIYTKDTDYLFLIGNTNPSINTIFTIQEKDGINIAITKNQSTNVSASITVNYTDYLASTTSLKIYLNRTNISNFTNQINVATWTAGAGNQSHVFSLTNYSQAYLVHIVALHGVYGTIDRTYSVQFTRYSTGIQGIPEQLWLWFAIAIMFFTGAVFTKSTAELGLIIICAEGWIFLTIGMFSALDSMQNLSQTEMGIWLTIMTVIGFLAYIKKSQSEGGYT